MSNDPKRIISPGPTWMSISPSTRSNIPTASRSRLRPGRPLSMSEAEASAVFDLHMMVAPLAADIEVTDDALTVVLHHGRRVSRPSGHYH